MEIRPNPEAANFVQVIDPDNTFNTFKEDVASSSWTVSVESDEQDIIAFRDTVAYYRLTGIIPDDWMEVVRKSELDSDNTLAFQIIVDISDTGFYLHADHVHRLMSKWADANNITIEPISRGELCALLRVQIGVQATTLLDQNPFLCAKPHENVEMVYVVNESQLDDMSLLAVDIKFPLGVGDAAHESCSRAADEMLAIIQQVRRDNQ